MKLTLYEFKLLPEQEQYSIIFNEGIFLDHFEKGNQRFALYAIDMFFVEVEYNTEKNKIRNIIAFRTGKTLNKYSINLTGI